MVRFDEIDIESVATTILLLQFNLIVDSSENSISYNTDSVAESIGLVHHMGCQEYSTLLFAFGNNRPKMSSIIRIKSCRWLIQKDNNRVTDQTYCH